jgi:hypothetical protein
MSVLMKIIVSVIIILVLIAIFNYFFGNKDRISSIADATKESVVEASKLPYSSNSSNYTWSIWFYVDDWNYKYGQQKIILGRYANSDEPSPEITLGEYQNTINVAVQTYPDSSLGTSGNLVNCKVNNVPIQSWTHLIVSLNTRSMDIYLDGKLVKTCILPGVVKVNPNASVKITPNGGFGGYTSNIKYFGDSLNPQQAWDLYVEGYGEGSYLGEIFNKYRVKVAVLEGEKEYKSFTI